jgi:sugar diacid utilization regulator
MAFSRFHRSSRLAFRGTNHIESVRFHLLRSYRHSLHVRSRSSYISRVAEDHIQALLDGLAAELGAPVVLEDVDHRLLAHTEQGEFIDEVRRSSIMGRRTSAEVRSWFQQWGIRESHEPVRTPADARLGALERWCVPVRFRGIHLGYVWVLDRGGIAHSALGPSIETAEQIAALLYRRRLSAQADTDLLRLLLIPNPENEYLAAEARTSGAYTHEGPIAVVVAGPQNGEELSQAELSDLALAARRAAEQASSEQVLSGVISQLGVLLTPLRNRTDLIPARRLAESLCRLTTHVNEGLGLVAAIGGVADLDRASRSYSEARRALRMARAMPDLGPIVAWDELGVFRALALLPPDEIESGVLDPRVRALLTNYELAATAEAFLDLAGNVQKTAARLHLHRATLYQRLDRIAAAYNLDLRRNGDHRLLTHLGLKLALLADMPLQVSERLSDRFGRGTGGSRSPATAASSSESVDSG